MLYAFALLFFFLLPLTAARAVCPICTVAVCASVGLSRWLGLDDTISGLWIGGLAVSVIVWTINWLNKKKVSFFGRQPLIVIGYYLLIIGPLSYYNMIDNSINLLWGINKLLLGIIIGSVGFACAALVNEFLKKKNSGHAFFPFQKVILPISALLVLSLIFYLICTLKILN